MYLECVGDQPELIYRYASDSSFYEAVEAAVHAGAVGDLLLRELRRRPRLTDPRPERRAAGRELIVGRCHGV